MHLMKQQVITRRQPALRFRQWSRKGYAAFISLQREVTIGHLSSQVSDRFQMKNQALHNYSLSGASGTGSDKVVCEEVNEGTKGSASLPGIDPVEMIRAVWFLCFLFPVCKKQMAAAGKNLLLANNLLYTYSFVYINTIFSLCGRQSMTRRCFPLFYYLPSRTIDNFPKNIPYY